jgi:2-dehydro-3-deoxyphosphooctonate aldolase (KDO 8-P synthase)
MNELKIKDFIIGKGQPLTIISGPCVIESYSHALMCARELKQITDQFNFNFIFKASYDKANRSSIDSFRGPGIKEGLDILKAIKEELDVAILTDIHTPQDAIKASNICDIIQIPAFLCRQTDLVVAAGKSGCTVNIKKGQFISPWDIKNVINKILSTNNNKIMITERGTCFGYNNLVSDFRSIPIMQSFGFPVCFDASHSIQLPGGQGALSGGNAEYIPHLSKAAIAVGTNALFIETHPNPSIAKSDPHSVMNFDNLKSLLKEVEILYNAINYESNQLC